MRGGRGCKNILTKMRKLKTNMRYLMQLRQSPSMLVPRAEASPCPCRVTKPRGFKQSASEMQPDAQSIHTWMPPLLGFRPTCQNRAAHINLPTF